MTLSDCRKGEIEMPQIKVSLSIGIANAAQEDVLDICDEEWAACKTKDERNELMESYWMDWSNNYIDGYFELVEDE
jgi:hypothetical protein